MNYNFTPIELLTLNVGNTFYSLENFEDTNEIYLKTTVNTLLSPTLSIFYDWDQSKETGLFYSLSVAHTFELMKGLGSESWRLGQLQSAELFRKRRLSATGTTMN